MWGCRVGEGESREGGRGGGAGWREAPNCFVTGTDGALINVCVICLMVNENCHWRGEPQTDWTRIPSESESYEDFYPTEDPEGVLYEGAVSPNHLQTGRGRRRWLRKKIRSTPPPPSVPSPTTEYPIGKGFRLLTGIDLHKNIPSMQ